MSIFNHQMEFCILTGFWGEIPNLAQPYNSVPSHFFIFALLPEERSREWPARA
jgi:hypothetical protein